MKEVLTCTSIKPALLRFGNSAVLILDKTNSSGDQLKKIFHQVLNGTFGHIVIVQATSIINEPFLNAVLMRAREEDAPEVILATKQLPWVMSPELILRKLRNSLLGKSLYETEFHYQCYSTNFLKRVPFDRNCNEKGFSGEWIAQVAIFAKSLVQLALPPETFTKQNRAVHYYWRGLLAAVRFRVQSLGFLYDARFDSGKTTYAFKSSPYSSHSALISLIAPSSRVLDIGCNTGVIAGALAAKGCVVDGVDVLPPAEVSEVIRDYYQIDLNKHPSDVEEILVRNQYDVILLGDVIEHLTDPEGFLEILRRATPAKSAVRFIASTGNVAFWVVRLVLLLGQFNYAPRGILDRTHRRLFTIRSLRRIFRQSGFTVQCLRYAPMPFSLTLRDNFRLAMALERINNWLARILPGLFAFQIILEACPQQSYDWHSAPGATSENCLPLCTPPGY